MLYGNLTHILTYNANGGTNVPASQTKNHGVAITLSGSSTSPTRTNYEFVGWGTSSTATAATYMAGESYIANASITLYAIWKLAYTVPSITDLIVYRCDENGNDDDYGTYFKVEFGWSTSQLLGLNNVKSIKIEWKLSTTSSYPSGNSATVSGQSGISGNVITDKLGAGAISVESVYDIRVTVTDSTTQNPNYARATRSLPSAKFLIDFKSGGDGVAIGKPANTANLFDVAFPAKFAGTMNVIGTSTFARINGATGFLSSSFYTGGKTSSSDKKPGVVCGASGVLYLQTTSSNTPGIRFYKGEVSSPQATLTVDDTGAMFLNGYEISGYKVLYNNATGTNGTVTLSETAANFKMIEIIIGYADVLAGSTKVYSPNGKTTDVSAGVSGSNQVQVSRTRCVISGKSIAQSNNYTCAYKGSFTNNENNVYIKTVIGYR